MKKWKKKSIKEFNRKLLTLGNILWTRGEITINDLKKFEEVAKIIEKTL